MVRFMYGSFLVVYYIPPLTRLEVITWNSPIQLSSDWQLGLFSCCFLSAWPYWRLPFIFITGVCMPEFVDLNKSCHVDNRSNIQKYVNGKRVDMSTSERDSAAEALEARINAYLQTSSVIQTNSSSSASNNGYTYVESGTSLNPPLPEVDFLNLKEGVPHQDFEKRKRQGEIMMSDYTRSSITVRRSYGMRGTITAYPEVRLYNQRLVAGGILIPKGSGWNQYCEIAGTPYRIQNHGSGHTCSWYTRIRSTAPVFALGPKIDPKVLMDSLASANPDTTSMITSALANINRSSVDVLTAFAEAPQSIGSLLRGFASVANILRDAKKGEFDLTKAHGWRKKRANQRYQNRISRLDKELRNPKLSSKRRKSLEDERNRIHLSYRDTLKRSADELASALADLWLNYRYNIMPNVYLAQDVFEATLKYGRKWITERESQHDIMSIPVGSIYMNCDIKSKITIKRNFSSKLSNIESVISNDIFVTAWELIPLSFVYDWFINIGDFLSAQNYKVTWDQNEACLSTKIDIDSEIDASGTYQWIVEPKTHVRGFYYRRRVINPSDHCGLVWQPNVGLERQFDALALIWRPVRSLLSKGRSQ